MANNISFLRSLTTGWALLNRWQQIGVACAVAAVVSLAALYLTNSKSAMCTLLEGRELNPQEMQKIQLALGQAGIVDFEIEGQSVRVPKSSVMRCLQAMSDGNAIPADMLAGEDASPAINIFMSRYQQDLVLQFEKKKQIREMVAKLPFVQQVWVQLDVGSQTSMMSSPNYSCVVSVMPRNERPLIAEQLHTIRQITLGSVAGIQTENIVVTDLKSGLALSADLPVEKINRSISQTQNELHQDRMLEEAIFNAVRDLGQPKVSVVSVGNRQNVAVLPGNESCSVVSEEPRNYLSATNTQARVPSSLAGYQPKATEFDKSEVAPSDDVRKKVRIEIPIAIIQQQLSRSNAGQGMASEEAAKLAFDEIRNSVESRIGNLMNAQGVDRKNIQIDFVLERPLSEFSKSIGLWGKFDQWSGNHSGAAIAILSGLALCVVLGLSAKRKSPTRKSAMDKTSPEEAPDVHEIRQQIDRLIDKDPDVVAQVLREWIHKAG